MLEAAGGGISLWRVPVVTSFRRSGPCRPAPVLVGELGWAGKLAGRLGQLELASAGGRPPGLRVAVVPRQWPGGKCGLIGAGTYLRQASVAEALGPPWGLIQRSDPPTHPEVD